MNVEYLLRDSMKTKPKSNRGARQKTSTPKNVTRMNYNENPYGMSDAVKKTVVDASLNSYMYQDFFAIDIKKDLADFYGLTVDHVCIGAGSSAIIDMLGEVFINYGDEVVYCSPTYEAFPDMISDNGGVRVELPLTKDYCYDLDAMLSAITDKTKMVIVCNPNNPTGTYVNSAKVEEFVRKLPEHVIAVVDEAYYEYVEDPTHYSLIKMIKEGYDRPLFVLRTFSKIYGMAGLRIGYTFADPLLIDELMKACQAWNVSYNALAAARTALKDQDYIKKIKALTTEGREYLTRELTELGCNVAAPCANFIYFDTHHDPKEIRAALAERKIMISAFDFNRVSVGTKEQNEAFINALKDILSCY